MKPFLLFPAILSLAFAHAQTTDSVDNIVFNIPKNWQAEKQSNYTMLMSFSKDRYCQVMFYQKQAAAMADKNSFFEKEWSDLVLASFDAVTSVQPVTKKLRSGQNVISYGVQAVNRSNNQSCYVELNMFDCGSSVQSAMLVSASKQHLQFFDSSWQSLIAQVKTSGELVTTKVSPITGCWGNYNFKPNGTYTLHHDNNQSDESGSYSVIETLLVIMPAKLPRRMYTWQLTETNLILTSTKDQSQETLSKK